jgi:non-specific serine/threonine protein kinase
MERAAAAESVWFFVDRVNAVVPNFSLNDTNADSVGRICLRLDGIPLALELAAARANVLSLARVSARRLPGSPVGRQSHSANGITALRR